MENTETQYNPQTGFNFNAGTTYSMLYRIENEIGWFKTYDKDGNFESVEIPPEQLLFMRQLERNNKRAKKEGDS